MKGGLIGFIVGFALASIVWLGRSRGTSTPPAETPTVSVASPGDAGGSPAVAAEEAGRRVAELEATNRKLLVDLMQARSNAAAQTRLATAAVPPVAAGPDPTSKAEALPARVQEMMQAAVRQQVEGRIARMKRQLNLTEAQEASIRELLEGQLGASVKMASRFFGNGEATGDGASEPVPAEDLGNIEERIRALLTPEQLAGYDTLQEEERVANARLVANSEMLQMQQSLGLSLDQQDKLYAVLYEQARGMMSPGAGVQPSASGANPVRALLEGKLNAVEQSGVLTAEQMQQFREMQEQQMRLIEAFVPKAGGPGAAPVIISAPSELPTPP